MDIPSKVVITAPQFGLNQREGTLIAISPHGYYELHIQLPSSNTHQVLLPVDGTMLMAYEPVLTPSAGFEVER